MRIITAEELKDILAKHKKWLYDEDDGKKADLRETDLQGAYLQEADLREADLRGACFQSADLTNASLFEAKLCRATFRGTNLHRADLYKADIDGSVYKPWLIIVDHIGNQREKVLYFADCDNVRYGCWNDRRGGTLDEFREYVNETYSVDNYIAEYLGAIKMFELVREAYLTQRSKGEEQ